MKTRTLLSASLLTSGLMMSCATVAPKELVDAREAYQRAAHGPAAQYAPADLHKAESSLQAAEKSFSDQPAARQTRDLAYVAERRAQISEAIAQQELDNRQKATAEQDFVRTQGQALSQTRAKLSQSELAQKQDAVRLEQERVARLAAEGKASTEAGRAISAEGRATDAEGKAANAEGRASSAEGRATTAEAKIAEAEKKSRELADSLAKLAAVKEEARGLVITLSGSVLFASNKSELLPSARARLTQVAEALASSTDRNIVVEGYTDSQGSAAYNIDLSKRRAETVRNFLVTRGLSSERTRAEGLGKESPVADNQSPEGRANNRRVEIVLAPVSAMN
jgi:outer membrane protein OmpA-like peptidoglycan-associated protein